MYREIESMSVDTATVVITDIATTTRVMFDREPYPHEIAGALANVRGWSWSGDRPQVSPRAGRGPTPTPTGLPRGWKVNPYHGDPSCRAGMLPSVVPADTELDTRSY